MSYRFLSCKTGEEHNVNQWKDRSVEEEIKSFENRTFVSIFTRFLTGTRARILEGGCGLGAWCEWFERQGHEVIGIEYNADVVARAKQYKHDVLVELGDVTGLKYPDKSFDVYVSLGVIEHFEHGPEQALKEAHRILKPSGLAFVSIPYLTVLRRFIVHPIRSLYFLTRKLRGQPNYFWEYRFTKKELQIYLEKAGFEIIHTDIDDYEPYERNRHIGLWADFFVLRKTGGRIWELNRIGRLVLDILRIFPPSWYCSGVMIVARPKK